MLLAHHSLYKTEIKNFLDSVSVCSCVELNLCKSGHCTHKSTWKFTDFPTVEQQQKQQQEQQRNDENWVEEWKGEPKYKQKLNSNAHGFVGNNRRECRIMQWNIGTLFRKCISIKPLQLFKLNLLKIFHSLLTVQMFNRTLEADIRK